MAIKKSEIYSSLWKSCDELRGGSFLPNWRVCRETLNSGVLGHEVLEY